MYSGKTFNKRQIYHGEEKPTNKEPVQFIRINGKEIGSKNATVTYTEEIIQTDDPLKSKVKRYIDISIEKIPEDKKKKEEDLKKYKTEAKARLLSEIGKLFYEIGQDSLYTGTDIDVMPFIKRPSVIFPLETEKTYGIVIDEEKKQALMINTLFDGIEKIEGMKCKDKALVESILKSIKDQVEELKTVLIDDQAKKIPKITYHFAPFPEKKPVFTGVDFANKSGGETQVQLLKVELKNGKMSIEEM